MQKLIDMGYQKKFLAPPEKLRKKRKKRKKAEESKILPALKPALEAKPVQQPTPPKKIIWPAPEAQPAERPAPEVKPAKKEEIKKPGLFSKIFSKKEKTMELPPAVEIKEKAIPLPPKRPSFLSTIFSFKKKEEEEDRSWLKEPEAIKITKQEPFFKRPIKKDEDEIEEKIETKEEKEASSGVGMLYSSPKKKKAA